MKAAVLAFARFLRAVHDGLLEAVESWESAADLRSSCHHHDDDDEADPDGPDTLTYHLHGDALHSLLEDAGIEARNGAGPSEAADTVMAEIELRYVEAGVEEDSS